MPNCAMNETNIEINGKRYKLPDFKCKQEHSVIHCCVMSGHVHNVIFWNNYCSAALSPAWFDNMPLLMPFKLWIRIAYDFMQKKKYFFSRQFIPKLVYWSEYFKEKRIYIFHFCRWYGRSMLPFAKEFDQFKNDCVKQRLKSTKCASVIYKLYTYTFSKLYDNHNKHRDNNYARIKLIFLICTGNWKCSAKNMKLFFWCERLKKI